MNNWTIEIPGNPVAQARCRASRTPMGVRMHDTKPVADYKAYAKTLIATSQPARLFDCPCAMTIDVYVQKPKSWPKRRIHADTKPDADNFAKIICDCLEGIVYTNDSRIVDLIVRKRLSDRPRVVVVVEPLEVSAAA